MKEKTVKEARYLLLQWENNNAQVGYSYKDPNTFEAIDISVVEAKEEEKERIEAFTRENKEGHSTKDPNKAKEDLITERTKEQKEDLLKKIVAFLGRMNIKVDVSKPNELVVKMARWATKEVEGKETIDFTKVKMLANIILEKKEDAVISKEKAQAIFMKWLLDTTEEEAPTFTSTEQIKEEMTQSTQSTQSTQITETTTVQPSVSEGQKPKYEVPNWRDKNMRIQVAQFFRQKGGLKGESTIANILIAMGKWFTEERGEMILSYSKLQSLAKVILKELNLYGGEGNETISDKDARITIMKWVTENILGSSMEGYMLKKILDSPNPSEFTIGNLRKLFETDALINFSTFRVSKEELTIVQKLWSLFLKEVLPNYFLETSALADELPISNYDSLMQLTGAKLLADLDIHTQFNQAEIQTFGTFIWDKISKYGIKKVEELRYTVLPALLAIAQLEPDLLRKALEKGDYQEVALSTLIEYHQNGYLLLKEHQDTLYALFTTYQKEVLNWRRKQALAQEVVQTYLQHAKGESLFSAFVLEQDYLLGKTLSINDYTSPDLDEWYKRLTRAVSDSFYPLDQKLIEFALNAFDPEEREFIFSLKTELYEASAQLEHTQVTPLISSYPIVILTQLKLEQTDLFVAVQGEEERWYALKKLDMDGGYVFYRVDKNPLAYLQYGLLNQKDIWGQGYKKVGDSILLIGNKYFTFITHIDRSKKLSQGEERQPLIDAFSRKHSDKLYDELYKSGNDKAILEQIWDVAKHLIPFYDCVTASIDKDVAVAVPSCTIDIVLLIPVFGQVTSLSSKFAFGMAKAMATGGIRNAIRQGARFTPKISEVKSVLVNIRRYLDPGIETIADGSKFVVKELVALKNEAWVKKNVKQLLKKIDGLVKETPTLPKDVIRTYLPGKGLEVPVKRMENESYRLVTDLRSGDIYGNPFWLRGNRLERFKEPASFTKEKKTLIDRLTKEIAPDQIFAVERNLNPRAYGGGKVMSVAEKGKETKYFITIDGHTVPVRVTPIEEHGVRYDVVDGEKVYPVNFNGKEWYFEPATSPFVSKKLAEELANKMDEFESIKDPSALSAPDEQTLMWNKYGRSYIKINDHYIPLIVLYKDWDWYHLVKKDTQQPMTVLLFEPENELFRLETSLDKELREGMRLSKVEAGPSQGIGRQVELPPPKTMPDPPGRGAEWNEFRNARDLEVEGEIIARLETYNVAMAPLSSFIPIATPVVYNNEKWLKEGLLKQIIENLPKKSPLDFRIYKGINFNDAPNFLKPFLFDLIKDYTKAQNQFQKSLEVCQELLTKERIAGTPQGQYLIKLFGLESVLDPEPILLEAVKRLEFISKKGMEFLQKTADWGYENILIVSTDLVPQVGSKKYRSRYMEYVSTNALMFPDDPECRLAIFADAFHLDPTIISGEELVEPKSQVIMHEVTHITSETQDFIEYTRYPKGIIKSGEILLEEYKMKRPLIFKSEGYNNFVTQLALYQNRPDLSRRTVWRETEKNDMLRVNLQISDAEMVMIIIRDFAEGRDFEGVIRVARSLSEELLGDGLMFIVATLSFVFVSYDFEKDAELEMTQEQTTDNPDLKSEVTNEGNHSTTLKREKREVNMAEKSDCLTQSVSNQEINTELIEPITKRSLLNIVEKMNSKIQTFSSQQTGIASVQFTKQQSFLSLVNSSKGESNRMSQNHIHSTNKQKELNLQR